MKLICIFKGNKLLNHSTKYNETLAQSFKEAIAHECGYDASELTAIIYDDADLPKFVNSGSYNPTKRVDIYADRVELIEIVPVPTTSEVDADWKSLSEDALPEIYTAEEILDIQENKSYYESLGSEKFDVGFVFDWPKVIPSKKIIVSSTTNEERLYKTITGVVVADTIVE